MPIIEVLKSTPRTREYISEGESEGKTLLDAMRDGKLEGMQDFDSVIKDFIEREVVTVEDGLSFATNPNNLTLSLKGMSAAEDFLRPDKPASSPRRAAPRPPSGFAPRPAHDSSMLDMIE